MEVVVLKIIIADDDMLIRESLSIILGIDSEIDILGVFENGKEAAEFCLHNNVDIAVLDVRMPILNGVNATKIIKESTMTKVVILTTFDEDEYIQKAMMFGASGYLLKNTKPHKIIDSLKLVNSGNSVIQEEVLDKLKLGFNNVNYDIDMSIFTEREIDVIREITNGLSNREISNKIFISQGTVKNYITSILQKTGLEHRTQIAIKYLGKF
ncbi:MAG: response regulator transcription factor [Sarcina sp.]